MSDSRFPKMTLTDEGMTIGDGVIPASAIETGLRAERLMSGMIRLDISVIVSEIELGSSKYGGLTFYERPRSFNPEMDHYRFSADGTAEHKTPVPCARCSRTIQHRGDDPTNEDLAVCGNCEAEIQDEIGASE